MPHPVDKESFWKQRIEDSKKYGDIHHAVYISSMPLWKNIEAAHKEILAPYANKRVLDAGCGYGRCASWFTDYVGVDLSPDLLEIAWKNNPDKTFIEARLEKLPLEDKAFDMAFCISIKAMIIGNLGEKSWEPIEKELLRVADEVLLLEYENPSEFEILRG